MKFFIIRNFSSPKSFLRKALFFVFLFLFLSAGYIVTDTVIAKEFSEDRIKCLEIIEKDRKTTTAEAKRIYTSEKNSIEDAYKTEILAVKLLSKNFERQKALKIAKKERQNNLKNARKIFDRTIFEIKLKFKSEQKKCRELAAKIQPVNFPVNGGGSSYQDPGKDRACIKNLQPVFTHEFTDLSQIKSITAIGGLNVGSVSRSYIEVKKDAQGNWPMVPLYAPTDATLIGIYYVTRTYPSGTRGEYRLEFQASCEVKFAFDHIANVSDKIKAMAGSTPAQNSGTGAQVSIPIKAGELLGSTNGTGVAGSWDFYLFNTGKPVYRINPSRWVSEHNKYADCPYDYFTPELKAKYYSALSTWEGTKIDPPNCGQASHDVAGTLAGGWFKDKDFDMGGSQVHITGHFNLVEVLFVRLERIKDRFEEFRFGFRAHNFSVTPEAVKPGDSVCYAEDGKYAYFTLVSDTELQSASGVGSCPASLPATYETWHR